MTYGLANIYFRSTSIYWSINTYYCHQTMAYCFVKSMRIAVDRQNILVDQHILLRLSEGTLSRPIVVGPRCIDTSVRITIIH